jgi:hypothetical protein
LACRRCPFFQGFLVELIYCLCPLSVTYLIYVSLPVLVME